MNLQQGITEFESQFSGAYPFTSDGVVVGTPNASFEEEMQTMITFAGGFIDTDVLYHENMHQWWGDNVTESSYNLTYFKEGLATLAEFLYQARLAERKAGGPYTHKGQAAFQASLVHRFNSDYAQGKSFWTVAPSNPQAFGLFSGSSTYDRPGIGYIALRQILGHGNFTSALQQIQRTYGGGSVTEAQLEAGLPPVAAGADQRLQGQARRVLQAVVGHGLRFWRREEPASDHRSWPRGPQLLPPRRRLLGNSHITGRPRWSAGSG